MRRGAPRRRRCGLLGREGITQGASTREDRPDVTLLLVVLMLLFAAASGFLGDFLELAGVVVLVLVVVGAAAGAFLYVSVPAHALGPLARRTTG